MRKKIFWNREDINRLKDLINQKSDPELLEIFDCEISELSCIRKRYKIKRDPEFLKQLRYSTGEESHQWKGGKKESQKRNRALQKEKFPEQVKARDAISNAIKTGKILKPEMCSECGEKVSSRNIHFHHTDGYEEDKWFVGIWICRRCHRKQHQGTH